MNKYTVLLVALALAGGFYFDRWLHRPIVVQMYMHKCVAPNTTQL